MPKISVIVPIYKVEKYLNRCIDSILNQTFTDFECILIDDGSPDRCPQICDEYAKKDRRIKVIHKENGGVSAARNTGLNEAKGEYISFVDSDDWVHPQMLEILYEGILKNNVLLSECAYEEVGDKEPFKKINNANFEIRNALEFLTENSITAVVPWNKLYHKSLFFGIRYPVGRIHEDEFVTYKILYKAVNLAFCNEKLYKYFFNNDGLTKKEENLVNKGDYESLLQYREFFLKKRIDMLDALKEKIHFFADKDKSMYEYAQRDYINCVEILYCQLYKGDKYIKDDGTLISIMKNKMAEFEKFMSGFEKLYFFMIKHGILRKWIAVNEFKPIQKTVLNAKILIYRSIKKVFK